MSTLVSSPPRVAVDAKLVRLAIAAAIGAGVFLTGFVQTEPAPYELYMAGLMGVWALLGLSISSATAPLLVLLVLFNIGGQISMTQMADLADTPLYLAVTLFLSLTAIFFAAILERRPELYRIVFSAWVLAACVTGLLGMIGYFGLLPGSERFTLYDRAAGAFKDPNVFGPYLVLPAIWLLHLTITGRPARRIFYAAGLAFLTLGIFLSFSRGAWGLYLFAASGLVMVLFLHTTQAVMRLRIVTMALVAAGVGGLAVVAILQLPVVSELFETRAQLVQSYDGARLGRFARFGIGFQMAMEHPLGIGPLVFGTLLGEDTHNIWLKTLLDYSWLGFASFLLLTIWTIAAGFRLLLRDRPWQPFLLCAWLVFIGHIALGTVIDINHWRHLYLLLGIIWGAIALERRYGSRAAFHPPRPNSAPARN